MALFYNWDSVKYPLSVGCPACQWFMHPFSTEQIARKLGGRKRRCSSFVKLYLLSQENGKMISQDRHYILPNMKDRLAFDLGGFSLTHKVVGVAAPKWGTEVALAESSDGTSNIDAEFIDELLGSRRGG